MDTNQFNQEVYQVVDLIPHGRVTTYGAIAKALGHGTARMVGHAMGMLDHLTQTPFQRVVNSSGRIYGYDSAGGRHRAELLQGEGIEIVNGKIIKFKTLYWDPLKEIE